jgi:hypothetical protein
VCGAIVIGVIGLVIYLMFQSPSPISSSPSPSLPFPPTESTYVGTVLRGSYVTEKPDKVVGEYWRLTFAMREVGIGSTSIVEEQGPTPTGPWTPLRSGLAQLSFSRNSEPAVSGLYKLSKSIESPITILALDGSGDKITVVIGENAIEERMIRMK